MKKRNVRFTDEGQLVELLRQGFEQTGNSSHAFEGMPEDAVAKLQESLGLRIVDLQAKKITVDPFSLLGVEYDYALTVTYEE